ncbi:hypothetical protein, partial [Priestia megaterium]|uniref:hypothetical protein n=1 Tax=Priestia megaterium TaxID=1404 RepID=UPI001F3B7060
MIGLNFKVCLFWLGVMVLVGSNRKGCDMGCKEGEKENESGEKGLCRRREIRGFKKVCGMV